MKVIPYRFECCNITDAIIRRYIVNCDPSVLCEPAIWKLAHAFESAVSCSIVHSGSPVIAEVLTESATCACGPSRLIVRNGRHRGIKTVPSNNLVDMWRAYYARVDKRIKTLNNELRTSKSHHCSLSHRMGGPKQGECQNCKQMHVEYRWM